MIEALAMYPEFAAKFWDNLKISYNLADDNININVKGRDPWTVVRHKPNTSWRWYDSDGPRTVY